VQSVQSVESMPVPLVRSVQSSAASAAQQSIESKSESESESEESEEEESVDESSEESKSETHKALVHSRKHAPITRSKSWASDDNLARSG
jgi:hypothetical protein